MNLFDMHCDTLYECYETGQKLRENHLAVNRAAAMQYKNYGQVFALFCGTRPPQGAIPGRKCLLDAPAAQRFSLLLDTAKKAFAENADWLSFCRSGEEIESAHAAGKMIALLSVEGAELLPEGSDMVTSAYAQGIRLLNPTWNNKNRFGTPASFDILQGLSPDPGLTEAGRWLVRECETAGILIDVSHLSEQSFWDVCETAQKPFVASHSNALALCTHCRNLNDAQFAEIMRRGGVVGINFYTPFLVSKTVCRLEDVLDHIEHFLGMYGETQLCIGADLDGCDSLPAGVNGLADISKLAELMLQKGYKESTVNGLFYDNFYSFLKKTLH